MTYLPAQDATGAEHVAPVLDMRTRRPVDPTPAPADVDHQAPADVDQALPGEVLPAGATPWDRIRSAAEQPLIPGWMTDRAVAGHRARWLARAAARQAARHAIRAPLYLARATPPIARGAVAGGRVWWRWMRATSLYTEAADLRGDSKGMWEAAYRRAQRAREIRTWVSLAGLPVAGVSVWVSGLVWGPLVWWGTGTLLALAAGVAGRRPGERILTSGPDAPARPIELGMPDAQMVATVTGVMRSLRLDVTALRSTAHPWGWDVDVMAGQALSRVADRIDEIETRLRTRAGAVTLIGDSEDAGRGTLRIVWADPYASMPAPPRRAPGSVSVRDLADIGRTLDGSALRIPLLAHTGIVGKSGSGKSSALWTILDVLTAASDVVVMGIDLSDGPALNTWGDLIARYASTPEAARGLLMVVIAISHARAAVMGRRMRPTADSRPGERVDENWQVTPDEPALILVIDEYPLVVAAKLGDVRLGDLVEEVLRVGRKAGVYVHIASQRAGRTEMGTTTVKAMMTSRMLLACEAGDVEMLMGPGQRARGWQPDRLQPATPGQPNDAGRCYVSAPGHSEPRVSAVYRLDAPEVRDRAIERLRHAQTHGRPTIDRATWDAADAYARRRWDAGLDELLSAGVDVDQAPADVDRPEAPRVLADVRAVMEGAGVDRMHTADILAGLVTVDGDRYAGWDECVVDGSGRETWPASTRLAEAVHPYGIRSGQTKIRGINRQGYALADIVTAIEGHATR